MYDMGDAINTGHKKTNSCTPKRQSVSTFTDAIYTQSQPPLSSLIDPLSSSLQGVSQCPEATSSSVKSSGKLLSHQVREYYQKYSRDSNLDQYFSLPDAGFEGYSHQWRSQISNAIASGEPFSGTKIDKNYTGISRERRKWNIGQSSSVVANSQILHHHHHRLPTDMSTSSPEECNKYSGVLESHESHKTKNNSPTSSVASNRPLEWDNGADLGYENLSSNSPPHDNCSSLLRLDPEGRTCPNIDATNAVGSAVNNPINKLSLNLRRSSKPDAHSTQTITDQSIEFGDDNQVTPIIKSNLSGIITGHINADDKELLEGELTAENPKDTEKTSLQNTTDTPKFSGPIKSNSLKVSTKPQCTTDRDLDNSLKKSASMNVLAMPLSNVPVTMRSQSEFNLHAFNNIKERGNHPTNFYSTSSITTIVTKPLTCDKDIQTNFMVNIQSKGIQVPEKSITTGNNISNDVIKREQMNEYEESTPALPKRVSSLAQKRIASMPINSNLANEDSIESSSKKHNDNAQSPSDYETDDGGRASNSFEYFPGDIYQNASTNNGNAGGITSRMSSSMETRMSRSTMPNTSSSFDEKLWGDSDNLLRDLERSLHVLKSLVDANKCDKQVKKRLIHHVIKRLVTAKYTDDKIEHDLADNVPWNPDDTRTKVYRTEIIHALANKQKLQQENSTENTDEEVEELTEAEEWQVTRIRSATCGGKRTQTDSRDHRKIIDLVMSTENSDIFEGRNTDRTDAMQDGRKARMGLRKDDRRSQHHHNHHQQQHHRKNIIIDIDKSESSECFLPQSQGLNYKEVVTTNNKPTITKITAKSQTSSATPNTMSSHEISSQCKIDDKRKQQRNQKLDWRLPTTISERRFDYGHCTSRLGTATRLIDYVEMEKKNQLVWINSEIDHLSNLKKLLEEPKKYENIADKRISPRKTILNCDKRSNSLTSTSFDLQTITKQWSSHGNIAERCEKTCNNNTATKVFTKRNSGTQTAVINTNGELSRCCATNVTTAADILTSETSDVRVQTLSPTALLSRAISPRRYCRQHNNKRNDCRCKRPSSLSPRRCREKLLNDRRPVFSPPAINSKKDAKNLLNDQCKSEFNDVIESQDECCLFNRQHHGCRCDKTNESSTSSGNDTANVSNDSVRSSKRNEQRNRNIEDNTEKIDELQEIKSCRVCGTIYSNDNRQCQCILTHMKPIAYELSFKEPKKPSITDTKKLHSQPSATTITLATHENCKTSNCSYSSAQPQLKDYLAKNKPEFVGNVEMRKRYMTEITQLRQLKKEKRKQLLAMASPNSFIITEKTIKRAVKSPRKITDDEMKIRLRMRYLRLNEVRNKRRQREKEEQTRRNHLMAKIFCKKLQQKVLKGQVDVSQSVSVISNI